MGNSVSAAKALSNTKLDEVNYLVKVLDSKRQQFLAEVISKRGGAISTTEVNGGRSVVRQSEIRVATSSSPSSQIKDAIGSFFEAAQGGNKGKQAVINGATSLVSAGIDALFGVSAGQGMEKRGFLVLFLNFAFVRVDYYVYSYCVSGEKWGTESSTSGCCQVTDLCVLDPSTLTPSEIDYLISSNITIETDPKSNSNDMAVVMQIKIMLSMSAALNRIIKDPQTDFKTLTDALDQIKDIQGKLSGEMEKLPTFKSTADCLNDKMVGLNLSVDSDKNLRDFLEGGEGDDNSDPAKSLNIPAADWDGLSVEKKREKLVNFEKANELKNFKDLTPSQRAGVTRLLGYDKDAFNRGKAKTNENGEVLIKNV